MYHPLMMDQLRVDQDVRRLQDEQRRRSNSVPRANDTETPRAKGAAAPRTWWPRPRRLVVRLAMAPVGLSPLADRRPCPHC